MTLRAFLFVLVTAALPTAALAQSDGGPTADPDRTLSPYFFVEGADGVEAFPLQSTHVWANVSGVFAEVKVEQVYRNDGKKPIHARYVFPASTRAAVHGMTIEVGGQRVVAKIEKREQAEAEFEEAKAEGKTASLLEQDRPNVFTMAVANILPGDRVSVELRYSELLVPSEGTYQLVYPTVVGPRYSNAAPNADDQFVASSYLPEGDASPSELTFEASVSAGMPISGLWCNSHAMNIAWNGKSAATAKLAKEERHGGNRDLVLEYKLSGDQIQSGLLLSEHGDERHFLLMVQPPSRVAPEQIPRREYVFVLDVSGSMDGFPLDTAKALLQDLVSNLRPTDSFNVVLFAGDTRLLSPQSLSATPSNVRRALDMIAGERGAGGTELEAALETTLALPRQPHVSRSVLVITDGFIAQERGAFELIAENLHDTNVFAFGIGSGVNRYLIEGLARTGQGEPFAVTDEFEALAVAKRFRRYVESPVLTGVEVKLHGFDAYDVEPLRQPDLFAERPVVVIGKWRGARGGEIEVTGRTVSGAFSSRHAVSAAELRPEHASLPRLWARSRIARLSDFDVTGTDERAIAEVTQLGLQHSLLTKHTSFIAVLEQVRNTQGAADEVDQPLPLPLGVSNLAVGDGYAMGDEPDFVWLLALLLAGFAVVHLRNTRARARSGS